jgi:hypothetical protein
MLGPIISRRVEEPTGPSVGHDNRNRRWILRFFVYEVNGDVLNFSGVVVIPGAILYHATPYCLPTGNLLVQLDLFFSPVIGINPFMAKVSKRFPSDAK